MEQKLPPLQRAHLLNSIETNDANRQRSRWSLYISIIALICSLTKGDPIGKLIEWKVIIVLRDQYSFPFLIAHNKVLLLYTTLLCLTVVGIIILHVKYSEDSSCENLLLRCLPTMGIFVLISCIIIMFRESLPAFGFFFAVLVAFLFMIAIKWLFNILIRLVLGDKYKYLKEL